MKTTEKILFVFVFLFSASFLHAQEYLTGLGLNEQVADKWKNAESHPEKCGCGSENQKASMSLPFFDDFTGSKVYPDKNKWADRDAFVNQSFPFRSVNHGVATLDALNNKGAVYEEANWVTFVADHLTANPIRTDSVFSPSETALSVEDSLYLSFFYQPQGRGDEPEPWDSLLLQFSYRTGDTIFDHMDSIEVQVDYYLQYYNKDTIFPGDTLWAPPGCNPNVYSISYEQLVTGQWVMVPCDSVMVPETKWRTVWSTPGMSLLAFQKKYKTNFRQVLVPLDDTIYFFDAFQFRFVNLASIANDIVPEWKSNCDQWNVDYVYLNKDRSSQDTTYAQVGFTDNSGSFLKRYRSMPYRQYRADAFNSIAPQFKIYYANLDSVTHEADYYYQVKRLGPVNGGYEYGDNTFSLQPYYQLNFGDTLPPWQLDTMICQQNCSMVSVGQYFDLDYNVDSMSYSITHYLSSTAADGTPIKDSLKYHLGFYNYFAYDDGVPELGYGIEPAGAECAYRFSTNTADTLQAVQIYFNRTLGNANEVYFKLKIWRDNNGKPGEVAYEEDNVKVAWNNSRIYGFHYYALQEPVVVSGKFYVGWEQYQNGSLNVGFDANSDARENIFYTVDGEWHVSAYHGALMMRPVVGYKGYVGLREQEDTKSRSMVVYPNPANQYFNFPEELISSDTENDRLTVYNLMGVPVITRNLTSNRINIARLTPGIYIVQIIKQGKSYTSRLVIRK